MIATGRDSLTDHALARLQQRGLPPLVIDWLHTHGREHHDGRGATILYFDKRARRSLERTVGREPVRRMKQWLNAYAVVGSDGRVVTAGHRYRRVQQ
jgi:hypothetical protein